MPRPISALVDLVALRHNLARARAFAPSARVWAVVKARAYGHGLEHAVAAFDAADGLAVLEYEGAARLRELGWRKPVLMLEGAFEPSDVEAASRLGLSLAVHDRAQIEWLRAHRGSPIEIHLKINTGMNRLGFPPDAIAAVRQELASLAAVRGIVLMSHFANSDLDDGVADQLARFERCTGALPGERCLANSAATIGSPATHRDWIRPGIMLYGASPFAERSAASLGLRPAMTLRSALIAVQSLAAGDAVGYGSTFVADRPMRIGVVACGYADGYPRHAPSGTPVAVDGVRTRTVGRVSMDMLTVDLTPAPGAGVGSSVELWGPTVPVDEVARSAGTIGYELLCAVAPRVPVTAVGG
jgi:alanine racemase